MIQVQLIQVEISTNMRGDLHALFTSTFHFPTWVLSDVFGVQAGMRANYHRVQQTSVGKDSNPSSCSPTAGRNTWLTEEDDSGWAEFGFSTFAVISVFSKLSDFHSDRLIDSSVE